MNEAAAAPRRRRWPWLLAAGVLVLLALVLAGHWAVQPQRSVRFLLDRLEPALGLRITFRGVPEYRLRGTPQIVLRGLDARQPGAAAAVLTADRALLALPWSTIRARGSDLTVDRIELDRPRLDLPALQAWQRSRPSGETRIPTLLRGLAIKDGSIVNDDWTVDAIGIELPFLAPGKPLAAKVHGRYRDPPIRIDTALDIAMSAPAADAGVGVIGAVDVVGEAFSLPSWIRVRGPLHLGADEVRMSPATLSMRARYVSNSTDLPFRLGLHGPVVFDKATLRLRGGSLALRGSGTIPHADAQGDVAVGRRLLLDLEGRIAAWPDAWPALPPPLGQSRSPLPFALGYEGRLDLSDVASLALRRDETRFDARFRLPQVTDWIDAKMLTSPLPPLDGRLTTPTLEIAGATLHGVQVEFDEPSVDVPVR